MKDLSKLRRHVDEGKPQAEKSSHQPPVFSASSPLPADTTLPVMRKMISFILSMDSTCSVELFLISCKVRYSERTKTVMFVPVDKLGAVEELYLNVAAWKANKLEANLSFW